MKNNEGVGKDEVVAGALNVDGSSLSRKIKKRDILNPNISYITQIIILSVLPERVSLNHKNILTYRIAIPINRKTTKINEEIIMLVKHKRAQEKWIPYMLNTDVDVN